MQGSKIGFSGNRGGKGLPEIILPGSGFHPHKNATPQRHAGKFVYTIILYHEAGGKGIKFFGKKVSCI